MLNETDFFPIPSINKLSDLAAYIEIISLDNEDKNISELKELLLKAAKYWAENLRGHFYDSYSRKTADSVCLTLGMAFQASQAVKEKLDETFIENVSNLKKHAEEYFSKPEKHIQNLTNKKESMLALSTLVYNE